MPQGCAACAHRRRRPCLEPTLVPDGSRAPRSSARSPASSLCRSRPRPPRARAASGTQPARSRARSTTAWTSARTSSGSGSVRTSTASSPVSASTRPRLTAERTPEACGSRPPARSWPPGRSRTSLRPAGRSCRSRPRSRSSRTRPTSSRTSLRRGTTRSMLSTSRTQASTIPPCTRCRTASMAETASSIRAHTASRARPSTPPIIGSTWSS